MPAATIQLEDEAVEIPGWVIDLASFRKWIHTGDLPEKRPVCFLRGEVWIDLCREELFSHNQVRAAFSVLGAEIKAEKLGHWCDRGLQMSNVAAEISTQPDGVFVSCDSLDAGRIRIVEGAELEGVPEMVLEIVSNSSVRRDTVQLKTAYAEAGIREYWLVDARGKEPSFDILKLTAKRYVAAENRDGWLKSDVFGKSYRLTAGADRLGFPDFTLEVR